MNTGSLPFRIREVTFTNSGQTSSLNFSVFVGLGGVQKTLGIFPRKPKSCWKKRQQDPPSKTRLKLRILTVCKIQVAQKISQLIAYFQNKYKIKLID
jgi:hypothetical protein